MNQGCRGEKPSTNSLCYGTANILINDMFSVLVHCLPNVVLLASLPYFIMKDTLNYSVLVLVCSS